MPPYTLGQAAKATGKQKSTILDAIKSGRLSATRNDRNQWQIDPAELFRIYPQKTETERETTTQRVAPNPLFEEKIKFLEQQLASLNDERERERRKDAETIDDLRRRLDDTEAKRERATAQLTALLSDQRATAQAEPFPRKRGWFGWR